LATTPSVPRKHGRPLGSRNRKTLAVLVAAAATVSTEAATTAATGNSSGIVAGVARQSRRPPKKQQPAYTSVNGYTTFLVPLWAGSEELLPLPFKFVDTMEGDGLMHAIVEECSGGQPSYPVEIFHYGEGKSYLRDGWPKFFEDYGLKEDWSLIFSCCDRAHFFCIRIIDSSYYARAFSAWV
jgi:hypothetical protein